MAKSCDQYALNAGNSHLSLLSDVAATGKAQLQARGISRPTASARTGSVTLQANHMHAHIRKLHGENLVGILQCLGSGGCLLECLLLLQLLNSSEC